LKFKSDQLLKSYKQIKESTLGGRSAVVCYLENSCFAACINPYSTGRSIIADCRAVSKPQRGTLKLKVYFFDHGFLKSPDFVDLCYYTVDVINTFPLIFSYGSLQKNYYAYIKFVGKYVTGRRKPFRPYKVLILLITILRRVEQAISVCPYER